MSSGGELEVLDLGFDGDQLTLEFLKAPREQLDFFLAKRFLLSQPVGLVLVDHGVRDVPCLLW